MAGLDGTIIMSNSQYRPCFVDGKKALFHKWESVSKIVSPSPYVGGHSGGVISCDFAIVEYEDGTTAEVKPDKIKFDDNLIQQYVFRSEHFENV